jgi:hypothetical protein
VNHPSLVIAGNVSWVDLDVMADVVNSVNNDTWWGQEPRVIKCTDFSWEMVMYGTCQYYFKIITAFELNKDTWDLKPLDEGDMVFDKLVDGQKTYKRATDNYENAIHALLDGYGEMADVANPILCDGRVVDGHDDPVPGPFRVRKGITFSGVGWPSNIPGITL